MSPIVYNINNATLKEKMASFDFDWTIVNPKEGKTFPSDVDDWEWLYPNIPEKIKEYYNNGYMIVIFTNQTKKWKHQQIKNVISLLEIPVFIVIATAKVTHKPNPVLFNVLIAPNNIDKDNSFFVGDALGRKSDHSDCDKRFAENIGVKVYSPEEMFLDISYITIPDIPIKEVPEIIIMVGYPGSGKSSVCKKIIDNNDKYIWIPRDKYKTPSKMKKEAKKYILQNKSIIFDATNSSIKSRKVFVDFGKLYDNYSIRCIHLTTSLLESYKRNKMRNNEEQVPKIAYSVYKKYYQEPNECEGFTLHKVPSNIIT